MTGGDLAAWRTQWQLSQVVAAAYLGVHRVTVADWERARDRAVPGYVAQLVKAWALIPPNRRHLMLKGA